MMTDFKIAKNSDGSYALVEFPDPHLDDGRPVVNIRATFRIEGGQKYFIHTAVTRQTLREQALLDGHVRREAEFFAAHPERIPKPETPESN